MVSILKKFLAMLLVLCMTLGLMAGCGSTTESTAAEASSAAVESEATAEAPAEEETPAEEPAEGSAAEEEVAAEATDGPTEKAIEVFGITEAPAAIEYPLETDVTLELVATFPDPLFAEYPNGMADLTIYKVAEEKTGVKMDYTPLSTSASNEQFNIMIASGDYPDLIGWGLNYTGGTDTAVEEEIYLDITEYIAEYAPNYWNILAHDDELLDLAMSDGGYIVGLHTIRAEKTLESAGMVIRTDLLEEAGLEKPYTIEDYDEVLAAFKDMGLEQPLMMLAPGAIQGNWLAGAYDVAAFCNNFPMSVVPTYVVDGEIKFGPIEEGFKEYITKIKEWYDKGYIHSDFITLNSNWNGPSYTNAITAGEAGIFYTDQGNIGGMITSSEVEGFAVEATYDMHATEDSVTHFAQYTNKAVGNGFTVTSNCQDIELACKWGDWWYSEEGSLLANYGVEGEGFEYDENGNPAYTELVTDNGSYSMRDARLIYSSNDTITCIVDVHAADTGYAVEDREAPEIWNTGRDDAYSIPSTVSMTAEETTEANNIYSDIETTCMEYIAKFINGDKDLSEWETMVETIKTMGIDDYLAIYQEAYDRAMG